MNTPKITTTTSAAINASNVISFSEFSLERPSPSAAIEEGSSAVIRFPSQMTATPYVPSEETLRSHQANISLYRECYDQIIRDPNIKLHILPMPQMDGLTTTYTIDQEIEFAQAIANLLEHSVGTDDMIVVAGKELLNGEFTEDEMLEVVLGDLALHLNKLYPVADRTSGKLGTHIGWAAVASVICSAHEILRMIEGDIKLLDRVKDASLQSMRNEIRFTGKNNVEMVCRQNSGHLKAVEQVCKKASATFGDYLSLPTTGASISVAAKNIFLGISDELPASLKLVV